MKLIKKNILKQKRRWRVRRKVSGTAARPRLSVRLTNQHIYVQCIDDYVGKTLCAVCTTSKELKGENLLPNMAGSLKVGQVMGAKLKAAGVESVVFDRGSRRYHGCVKALADAVRECGINF